MKKILILFVCICFSELILAQKYYPFPTSNAVWREKFYTKASGIFSVTDNYQKYIKGDTIIGNHLYHKIYQSGYEDWYSYLNGSRKLKYYDDKYLYSIREDSAKRIYLFSSNKEFLVYDFNLTLGDTLPALYAVPKDYIFVVSKIDSVLVLDNYHKRYRMNLGFYNSFDLIEGMGSSYGLAEGYTGYYNYTSYFLCFKQDGENAYPNGVECDLISTGIKELNLQNEIQVFPNPSTGIINISNLPDKPLKLQLFNMLGKLVYETQIQAINYSLNLDFMPGRIYLLKVTDKNKSIVFEKVILQ